MIQLIAIDMDGTLLNPDHVVSERNKRAIRAAQAKGIEVMIATGRGYPEALKPVQDAGLAPAFICLNGADVRDDTGEIVSGIYLLEDDIKQIKAILEAHTIDYQIFISDHVYTLDPEQQVEIFIQLAEDGNQVPDVEDIRASILESVKEGYIKQVDSFDKLLADKKNDVFKIFGASFNRENLDKAREALEKIPGIAVSSSGAGNIEITNINAQKGIALEAYTKIKEIPMENVMAIGDNFNDVSMFERAGRSVAMGTAPSEVKVLCTHETETNANDGVAFAIEAILDQK